MDSVMSHGSPTLYQELAELLQKDIETGFYVVGSLLPTEHELSAKFAVSRQTVRASLSLLQERGYISRKKAVGTRVESARPSSSYRQTYDSIAHLVRVAAEAEIRVTESVRRVSFDRAAARRLDAPLGGDWIEFSGRRVRARQKNQTVSWQHIYLDAEFEKVVALAGDHPDQLISTLLEQEYGGMIAEIRQTISATELPEASAQALGAPPGSPALKLIRHFKDRRGRILEISETIYPADSVRISSRIRRTPPEA